MSDRKKNVLILAACIVGAGILYAIYRKSKAKNPTSVKLRNGAEMPLLGLGTWKSKPGEVTKAVEFAIDQGYRHIDCAWVYDNEAEVGAALKTRIGTSVKREDVFIVSKLWNQFHEAKDVQPACEKSLENLGLKYLDLYLIHWPLSFAKRAEKVPRHPNGEVIYANVPLEETWTAMEELVTKGLVKAIGLSNFNIKQLERIVKHAKIPPVCLQVECHPYLTQEPLIAAAHSHGIRVVGYSPLGSPDRPWQRESDPNLLKDSKINDIATRYGKSPAQILLRFQVQRGVTIIPKSVTPARITQNSQIFDFTLSASDMQTIASFNRGHRYCVPANTAGTAPRDLAHPEFPFADDYK